VTLPALLPAATARLSAGDQEGYRRTIETAGIRAVLLASGVAGGLWVAAGPALALWLPAVPNGAVDAARILAIAFAINAVGGVFTVAAQAREELRDVVSLKVFMLVAAIILLPTVGRHGTVGLAVAMGVSLAVPGLWFLAREVRRLGPHGVAVTKWALTAVAAAVGAAAVAGAIPIDHGGDLAELLARGAIYSALAAACCGVAFLVLGPATHAGAARRAP
jgi:O-antigen/teichoic acid export membrane protein